MLKHSIAKNTFLSAAAAVAALACGACSGGPPGAIDPNGARALHDGILRSASGDRAITYEVKNGRALVEGDIVLRPDTIARQAGDLGAESFALDAGVFTTGALWPYGVVTYRYDASIPSDQRANIEAAIANYRAHTLVRFQLDNSYTTSTYLLFKNVNGDGCNSNIGFSPGVHEVHLEYPGCKNMDTAVHEIGHALGLFHEATRNDRDAYVTIQWANIQNNDWARSQFQQLHLTGGVDVGPFDFSSQMLYPSITADPTFAVDVTKPIITRKDGSTYPNPQPGTKGLSAGDVAGIATLYNYVIAVPNRVALVAGGSSAKLSFPTNTYVWADTHAIPSISVAGAPAGVIVTSDDTYGNAYHFQALSSAAVGTSNLTVLARSGSEAHSITIPITVAPAPVVPPPPATQLSLALSEPTASTLQGNSCGLFATTVGTAGTVTLSASNLPAGVTAAFGHGPYHVGDSISVGFWATPTAGLGTYPVILTATANGLTSSQKINVEIDACTPKTTCGAACGDPISNGCGGTLQCAACPACRSGWSWDPDLQSCVRNVPPPKCTGTCT